MDYRIQWEACLQQIRQRVNNEKVYGVWFADIGIESYDEERNAVVLVVPSRYVYEYLEMYCAKMLSEVLTANFRQGVRVGYRVEKETSFAEMVDCVRQKGCDIGEGIPRISVANARKRMEDGLRYFLGDGYRWLPGYDDLTEWLTDNKGRGLLLVGTSGLGKTLFCRKVLPVLLADKVKMASVTAQEMNTRINDLLKERCIVIDDLGTEDPRPKRYGTEQKPFYDLCNAAEQQGKLLVINTNLSTTPDPRYPSSIQERYGSAVISRLRAVTRVVVLEGQDMRK